MIKKVLASFALVIGFSANAVEFFPEISPAHPDYVYYFRAVNLDQEYIAQHLIDTTYHNYSSDLFFKAIPNAAPVYGKVVQILDGSRLNPRNLVLTVDEGIYYVRTELAAIHPRLSMARRWKWNVEVPPGIFLLVRGYRAGALPGEMIPVLISLRIAETNGQPLKAIEYYEDVGAKLDNSESDNRHR